MRPFYLARQAEIVRGLLPNADVRTDHYDVLRVHSGALSGVVAPLRNRRFGWMLFDSPNEDASSSIEPLPALADGVCRSPLQAARELANEIRRLSEAK